MFFVKCQGHLQKEELLHIYWMVCFHSYKEKRKCVVCAFVIVSDFSSLAANTVIVIHINSLRMTTDDTRLVSDAVDLFQVDLKTGLAIEEACYTQVCLHNQHFHERLQFCCISYIVGLGSRSEKPRLFFGHHFFKQWWINLSRVISMWVARWHIYWSSSSSLRSFPNSVSPPFPVSPAKMPQN